MNISLCEIVVSIMGHDKGKLFLVLAKEDGFLYLGDGKSRKAQKPKKKSIKHVDPTGRIDQALLEKLQAGGTLTNKEIRAALKNSGFEKNY